MKTNEINTNAILETELDENALEEVNGGLLCELAVAGAVAGAAIGTAVAIGTVAVVGGAIIGAAAAEACPAPRPAHHGCYYEREYYRETGYRW